MVWADGVVEVIFVVLVHHCWDSHHVQSLKQLGVGVKVWVVFPVAGQIVDEGAIGVCCLVEKSLS